MACLISAADSQAGPSTVVDVNLGLSAVVSPSQMQHQLREVGLGVQGAVLHCVPGRWQFCQNFCETRRDLVAMLEKTAGSKHGVICD